LSNKSPRRLGSFGDDDDEDDDGILFSLKFYFVLKSLYDE